MRYRTQKFRVHTFYCVPVHDSIRVFVRGSPPEKIPAAELFFRAPGLSGDGFSEFTHLVFELTHFIAQLFEHFADLGTEVGWVMLWVTVAFHALAEVLLCFVCFLVDAVCEIVQTGLLQVFGGDVHVLNAMPLLIQIPFEFPVFCGTRMLPVRFAHRRAFVHLGALPVPAAGSRTLGARFSVSFVGA